MSCFFWSLIIDLSSPSCSLISYSNAFSRSLTSISEIRIYLFVCIFGPLFGENMFIFVSFYGKIFSLHSSSLFLSFYPTFWVSRSSNTPMFIYGRNTLLLLKATSSFWFEGFRWIPSPLRLTILIIWLSW